MKAKQATPAALKALRAMNTTEIMKLIVVAKTGNQYIYRKYLPGITKKETRLQLQWFIDVALEGKRLEGK